MPIGIRTTQTVFSEKFQSLTCLPLHHNLESEGHTAAVEKQALVTVLKAMPSLTQLYAYIIDAYVEEDEQTARVFESILTPLPVLKDLQLQYIVVSELSVDVNVTCSCLERLALVLPTKS